MKLRLPHKFQAALMAVIGSVSFTTVSSASLGAGAFLLSTQHAAAQDTASNSLELNYNASVIEELSGVLQDLDEEKLAETTTTANEVGTGGVDDILQALNEIDSQEVVSPMAAGENAQPASDFSGVGSQQNFIETPVVESNGSEETAAPVAATYTPVLAQAPAASASLGVSSGSSSSGLGVSTGDSAAGIGSANLGITGGGDSSILAAPALLGAADVGAGVELSINPTSVTTGNSGINWTNAGISGPLTSWLLTFTLEAKRDAGDYYVFATERWNNGAAGHYIKEMESGGLKFVAGQQTLTFDNVSIKSGGQYDITLQYVTAQDYFGNAVSGEYTMSVEGVTHTLSITPSSDTQFKKGDSGTRFWTNGGQEQVSSITLTKLDDTIVDPPSALVWAGTNTRHTWTNNSNNPWQGGTFQNGAYVTFNSNATNKEVLVNSAIQTNGMIVEDAAYTFNVGSGGSLEAAGLAGSGGSITKTGAGTMTISGASTYYDGGVTVSEGTLRVTNADSAAKMLRIATGSGVLELGENVTLADGQSSQMAGTLSIMEGKTLTMGGGDGHQVNIASFSNVVLDGAQITYDAAASTINGVTVNSGKIGKIYVADLNDKNLVLGGTTTVNGELKLSNDWNSQFEIEKLVGAGTLSTAKVGRQWMTVTIDSLSDGDQKFTGDLNFAHNNSNNKEKVLINTGDQNVSFRSLSLDYPADCTMDFTLGADAAIAQMTLTSGTANIAGDHQLTVGTLSGSGPMNVEADVTLNGTNGYTGAINVNSGTLDLTSTVGTGDLTVADGATLKLEDANLLSVTGNLTLASGSMLDLSGLYEEGQTLTLATHTGNATYEGVIITGLGDGRKATLKDTGNTLQVTFGDVLQGLTWNGTTQNGTWNTSTTNWKNASGGNVSYSTGSNALFTSDAAQKTVTISSNITAGIVQVSDAYTFSFTSNSSNRTLTASELRLEGDSTLTLQRGSGSGTAHKLNITGDLKGNGTVTVGSNTTLTVGGNISIDEEDTITINNTTAATAAGLHADGALVKSGNGTLTINGTDDSYINKTITVTAGTLTLNGTYRVDNLPNDPEVHYTYEDASRHSSDTGVGGFRVTNGTRTVYRVNGGSVSGNAQFTVNGSAVTVENGKYSYADPDYTTLWVNGGAKLDYGEYYEASGGALTTAQVANGATLGLSSAHAVDKLAFQTDDCAINLSGTGAVNSTSGTGSINLVDGTLTMNGENTEFTGDVTVSGGTLKLGNPKALGEHNQGTSQTNTITVAQGGTLDLNGTIDANYTYTLDGGTLTNSGRAIDNITSQTVGLVLNNNSTIRTDSNHDFRLLARGYANTDADLQNHTLTKTGSGTFEFRNTAITAGKLDVQGGTLLFQDSSGRVGSTAANVDLNGGNLSGQMNLSAAITMQALQNSVNNVAINTNGYALTFSGDADTTISGIISGSGSLTKTGNGTLKLSGANSYTGNTVVNEGTLLVSGADSLTSTSLVTVNGGGNLQFDAALGSSAQASAITLASGSDGQAGGMLTFTGMNDNALNVDGVLTLGSGSILDVGNLNLTGMYGTVTLANTGGTIAGDVSQVTVQGLAEGYTYQLLKKHDFATNTDSLILTYNNPSESLIWRGNYDDLWVAESKATGEHTNWYALSNVWEDIPFSDNDRVRFMNDQEVRLGSDVHSGTMTVDRGKTVTVDTNGFNFSLGEIEGTDAALTVKGSDNKTTEFRDVVTIKDLTLDGGTVVLDKYSNVTGQLTVQNGADMTANSYVMANKLNIDNSSVELKSAGNNIQTVSVTDSSLKVDGSSLFGDLTMNGGTLTNAGDLQLTSAEMQGTSTITGAGSISTGALNLGSGSNTTVNGGQTISITSGEGISSTVGGPLPTLTLGDATITGTTAWKLHTGLQVNLVSTTETGTVFDTNDHIITVDSVLGGNGTLTKDGLGTLVLREADYNYTGNTTVAGGTLRLDNTNALVNAASVSVEGDSSLWLNTGSNALTLGTASIANGATLRLAGENLLNIADGKSLTLNNGAIIDVSSVEFTPGEEKDYVLATGSVSYTDLSSIQLTFEHGEHPAPGSTTQLLYENGQLLLRYTLNKPKDLIWDGGEAVWDVGSTEHWHSAETPAVSTSFNTYDDVTFAYQEGLDSKANVTAVDIHATDMYIEAGTVDDVNIVELNVGEGRQLDVDFIVTEDNTQIKKTGSGTAYLGVDDESFSSDMSVSSGTLTAQFVDMADNGVNLKVTGDLTRTGGELNVIVGDGYHDTYATFEQGTTVEGVTNIETKEMANVEFKGHVSIIGSNPTITAGDGTTISFKGTTSVDSNSMTFAGQGNVYMGENTTFSQGGGRHTYLKDAVNVTIEKMSTSQDQTFLLYDGTSLTIKDVYLEKTDGEQVMYTGYQAKADDTERQFITIDTIHFNNSPDARLAVGAISTRTAGEDEQQTGDIYVNTLISGTTESGEIVPSTFVFANYAKPRNDYDPKGVGGSDYDVPEVLHLGGDNDSQFAGTILVCDHNVNSAEGIGYGGTENARKDTLVILNDNTVAANAVFDFDVIGEYSDYGLGINADHVKILGIKGTELPGDDTFLIFSGNIGTALRAEYGSDNTVRTLELAGDDTYVSSGTVDKNLNLVKSGEGTQTFTGATDLFDGSIDIKSGTLEFSKANASLTVEDLTIAKHIPDTDVETLRVRNANGTVGTVELKGTLTAHGEGRNTGAALDANLTLGQDAVLGVRETVSGISNPDPELPGRYDYLGGMDMLGNSITLTGQSVLSDSDLQTLLGMQWGDRYELAFNLSSLTVGGVTYREDPIEFDREHPEDNIDASLYFSNLKESDYYICYSGAQGQGPGSNVGTFYIFKAPEPTTGTLSLLALAALAARRRRK